ncbi:NAD(P)-dependent dehydrogenase (short-subunit alcohol dehydrogenase family) [Catenuloplanes nepalensis]|uniref:NAD(P)-dependent dehydrogenase (Short-subunit alcohol dehydrogenase family) n=1 Tax=Catenuloplanes nepalensis TaxID=587533 RepID=A0ABT9MS14_9ACTN|nr:SDR family oxidoreductase [Catenuloplanes nepalensis]MDP9794234.1 NAD(P)-dependent dehydrogenase (short-subunit alcohol dehydrogenase family) [Catenuloplanes nepalensis]
MRIDFAGRRVLVTASTSGIGFAAAEGFAAGGAHVVINGRGAAGVEAALARLPGSVAGFAGDLGTESACARLVAEHPEFDIVVNNLGVYGPGDFFETPDSEWDRFFRTNVMSGVRLSRAYAPGMVARGWGRIVFVSSESALNVPPDMIHYGFTKTAQLSVSRGLAKRLAGTGVTVNAVLPGPTATEGTEAMLRPDMDRTGGGFDRVLTDFVATERGSSILRRATTSAEVANMILYVASAQASGTTGAALRVDGGVVDSIV